MHQFTTSIKSITLADVFRLIGVAVNVGKSFAQKWPMPVAPRVNQLE
jgi:hypothetical protein